MTCLYGVFGNHRYALDDVNQAYADMRSGVNIRGVVDFIPAG